MNPRQRSYDSYDKTNRLIKLTNSYYHNRNLDIIKNRTSQYVNRKPLKKVHKSNYLTPYQDFYVIQENALLTSKLKSIKWRPVKPKMNEMFSNKEAKIQISRQKYKNIFENLRLQENEKYRQRIYEQKAFISTKNLDKDYFENHTKTVQKLRQVSEVNNVVLPKINGKSRLPTENNYKKSKKSKRSPSSENNSGSDNESGNSKFGDDSASGTGTANDA